MPTLYATDDPHMIFDNNGNVHFRTYSTGAIRESKEYIETDTSPFYRVQDVNGVTSKDQLQVEITFNDKISDYDLVKALSFKSNVVGLHNIKIYKSKDLQQWKEVDNVDVTPDSNGNVSIS